MKTKQSELHGDDHYEIEESIEKLEEELGDKINEVLEKFNGQKVVIVSMCTC